MTETIVNVADLSLNWLKKGSRFEVGLGEINEAIGLNELGATLHVVPAGRTAWPYHRHHGCDELFLVLQGTGTLRIGERRLPIKAGDCIGCPPGGEAHQIINSSDTELRYIAFSNHTRAEVTEYPDSGRIAVDIAHGNDREPMSVFSIAGTMSAMEYWQGEDIDGAEDANG
jgi:uncharacterized cupin superfamily protein